MSSPKRILVLDDSETVLEAARDALEEGGFQVTTLNTPALFLRTLQKKHPDLVLVDVSMPMLGGETLVDITRRNRLKQCPILLYSDRPDVELEALVGSCGADGYISKRTRGQAFLDLIHRAIEAAAALRAGVPPL
jgi:DNA-binding response OmpR family regulator